MSKLSQFRQAVLACAGDCQHPTLRMASEGAYCVYYAPFDHLNAAARVVLVGITPGKTQASNALAEAARLLQAGASAEDAVKGAKRLAAFSGPMRNNLVAMLDHVGLNNRLGLGSCDALFGSGSELVQTTSVLPFPVFANGENYSGAPHPLAVGVLERQVHEHFVPLARQLSRAVFVPLGPVPTKVLETLAAQGHLDAHRILVGLPHPSGANGERIAYFLGRKGRGDLSAKTDPAKIDRAREVATRQVAALTF